MLKQPVLMSVGELCCAIFIVYYLELCICLDI
jgi:hypothetical protein